MVAVGRYLRQPFDSPSRDSKYIFLRNVTHTVTFQKCVTPNVTLRKKRKSLHIKKAESSTKIRPVYQFFPWSWRDSNSRPNEELICFLHVYLRLHCRGEARPKPPTYPLSSKVSPERRGLPQAISDIAAPPVRNASEPQHPGDVTSPQLLQGLSFNLLYFD